MEELKKAKDMDDKMEISRRLLKRRKRIQVKIETERGTAETEAFIDTLVLDPIIKRDAPIVGKEATGKFICVAEVREHGSNIKIQDPGHAILCQGCGFGGTLESETAPAEHKTVTIRVFDAGKKKILYGAMGNVTIEKKETGRKRTIAIFEFFGKWAEL